MTERAAPFRPQPDYPGVYRHKANPCRVCAHPNDAVREGYGGDAVPRTGDVSVCWRCGEVSVFEIGAFGMVLREPTLDELADFGRDHGDHARRLRDVRANRPG